MGEIVTSDLCRALPLLIDDNSDFTKNKTPPSAVVQRLRHCEDRWPRPNRFHSPLLSDDLSYTNKGR